MTFHKSSLLFFFSLVSLYWTNKPWKELLGCQCKRVKRGKTKSANCSQTEHVDGLLEREHVEGCCGWCEPIARWSCTLWNEGRHKLFWYTRLRGNMLHLCSPYQCSVRVLCFWSQINFAFNEISFFPNPWFDVLCSKRWGRFLHQELFLVFLNLWWNAIWQIN